MWIVLLPMHTSAQILNMWIHCESICAVVILVHVHRGYYYVNHVITSLHVWNFGWVGFLGLTNYSDYVTNSQMSESTWTWSEHTQYPFRQPLLTKGQHLSSKFELTMQRPCTIMGSLIDHTLPSAFWEATVVNPLNVPDIFCPTFRWYGDNCCVDQTKGLVKFTS